jgi:DNA repair protein RecO (recombination protein O)
MNQLNTSGIILSRTDFGEADRILTLLTPDHGKLRLIAKGVRRVKSKLAGGIELFSVSDVTYIRGRGDMGTLVSTRLRRHYGEIVKDIQRTMLGYDLIKMLNKATEDEPEPDYFHLLQQAFEALNDAQIPPEIIRLWFAMQLLRIAGHMPNLQTDMTGKKLEADAIYDFSFDDMTFAASPHGHLGVNEIKFLRLGFSGNQPKILHQVQNSAELTKVSAPLVQTMLNTYIRV